MKSNQKKLMRIIALALTLSLILGMSILALEEDNNDYDLLDVETFDNTMLVIGDEAIPNLRMTTELHVITTETALTAVRQMKILCVIGAARRTVTIHARYVRTAT